METKNLYELWLDLGESNENDNLIQVDMWSAASPSHRNRRRNCDLGITSKAGCEIIQHSPGNFVGFRQHTVHRYMLTVKSVAATVKILVT